MTERRGKPYPDSKLYKLDCYVCGEKAKFQWNACADGNVWRPLCAKHDVLINKAVLQVLYPKDWEVKLKEYCEDIEFNYEEVSNGKRSRTKRA